VVDDLQWADPASLTLLGLLLRRLDGVSLAAAYRADGTAGVDPAEALGVPAAQMTSITLGPLPAGAIRGLFGDQLLAGAIIRQAGRTPFTVTEVIAALARQGAITRDGDSRWRLWPGRDAAGAASIVTAGIGQAAGNRLAGLPSRYRDMLGLLALLDRPASAPLLAAASGTGLHSALDTLGGLGSAGLASPGPRGWAPGHELVRRAVTATMPPAETARCHALLGQALAQSGADPAEAGSHLAASGDHDGAAMAYAAAARRQLDRICDRAAMRLAGTGLAAIPQVPTFAEYVPVVSAAVSAGTRRAYGSYWNRVLDQWGDRRLDEPTPSEIRQLMIYVKTHVVARRNARAGVARKSTWWPRCAACTSGPLMTG